jgi:hypothetical protein
MRHEIPTLRALRARVQIKIESIARHDGEALTDENVQQLCGAMMLGPFGDSEPFRIRQLVRAVSDVNKIQLLDQAPCR